MAAPEVHSQRRPIRSGLLSEIRRGREYEIDHARGNWAEMRRAQNGFDGRHKWETSVERRTAVTELGSASLNSGLSLIIRVVNIKCQTVLLWLQLLTTLLNLIGWIVDYMTRIWPQTSNGSTSERIHHYLYCEAMPNFTVVYTNKNVKNVTQHLEEWGVQRGPCRSAGRNCILEAVGLF